MDSIKVPALVVPRLRSALIAEARAAAEGLAPSTLDPQIEASVRAFTKARWALNNAAWVLDQLGWTSETPQADVALALTGGRAATIHTMLLSCLETTATGSRNKPSGEPSPPTRSTEAAAIGDLISRLETRAVSLGCVHP
jgi:hypothetical protein